MWGMGFVHLDRFGPSRRTLCGGCAWGDRIADLRRARRHEAAADLADHDVVARAVDEEGAERRPAPDLARDARRELRAAREEASPDCALIGSRYTDGWATAVIGALVPVAVMPAR